ncbi:hypothetical protein EMIHUDRAFT_101573 [Emiliania huxleyi CCMP1516]|uniref:DUF1995 domain-containing protein n=2 Tax=Emiliania huxleyi TaxID=2903 RepID=A0A0D3JE07_EMIH1|nr:hypothetical protein EMIHUDRAFT_101573 [Emiliania huxleyi CCMP1516]EOD21742.1 hypothetical protein EMIHUDRAFT_101573 [Emiliania huxleyi CCMP1516]|eukprot:XP_005774171.1 hypothetical protein EMIHUDRAFT_101573 [Emiliania huxleyi CCMP1516]
MLVALTVPFLGAVLTIPRSPDEMVRRAAAAVTRASQAGVRRQIVKLVVPDDQRSYKVFGAVPIQGTSAPEDLDPWPGGLKQQYPIALGLARELLQGVTGASERLITDQGATPAEDAAVCLFAGCDQLGRLREVDGMAGADRLLCLLNPQFKRLEDFSLWQRGEARSVVFERGYECSFAFEEFACRGEDVKLAGEQGVGEHGVGWCAFVFLDDGSEGTILHEGALPSRPEYSWLEAQINARHPSPRQLSRVDEEGLRFMRRGEEESGGATEREAPQSESER